MAPVQCAILLRDQGIPLIPLSPFIYPCILQVEPFSHIDKDLSSNLKRPCCIVERRDDSAMESTASRKVIPVDDLVIDETDYPKENIESSNTIDHTCQTIPHPLEHTGCEQTTIKDEPQEQVLIRKRPGRPPNKIATLRKKKSYVKVWEFIRDLLKDPQYNPNVVSWVNRDEGFFRFEKNKIVTQLWAEIRKKKKPLTYEHFSRTMRYHYKKGYLQSVPNERLTFRFGPKATNWR